MASETVDPIDWPLPPTLYRAVPPEHHLHMHMRDTNQKTCTQLRREPATSGIQDHRVAYAATQGEAIDEVIDYRFL